MYMNKIQLQLPEPLYARLKLLAAHLDYSMAELLRRGTEQIIIFYEHIDTNGQKNRPPKPRQLGLKTTDPSKLRRLASERI